MASENKETKKRGRPRKVSVVENDKILTDDASETLMMEQKTSEQTTVNQVAQSLFSLYNGVLGTYNGNWGTNNINLYNPFLQNQRLKMINASPVSESADAEKTKLDLPTALALEPLIRRGLAWSKIAEFTGRSEPSVIT